MSCPPIWDHSRTALEVVAAGAASAAATETIAASAAATATVSPRTRFNMMAPFSLIWVRCQTNRGPQSAPRLATPLRRPEYTSFRAGRGDHAGPQRERERGDHEPGADQ